MKRTKVLESTAYHEAGHACVAFHYNIRPRVLSIVPKEGSLGRLEHEPYFTGSSVEQENVEQLTPAMQRKLENSVQVCLAGPWAEKTFNPNGFRNSGSESDYDQAINFIIYLETDEEVVGQYFKLLDLRAKYLVRSKSQWPIICHLAEALLKQPEMSGALVERTIKSGYQKLVI